MDKYKPQNVECKKYKPFVEELIQRCGSPELASRYSGVGISTFYRIRHNTHCTLQRQTALKIVTALTAKRKEDRLSNAVNPELRKAIKTQARIEENLERMVGY